MMPASGAVISGTSPVTQVMRINNPTKVRLSSPHSSFYNRPTSSFVDRRRSRCESNCRSPETEFRSRIKAKSTISHRLFGNETRWSNHSDWRLQEWGWGLAKSIKGQLVNGVRRTSWRACGDRNHCDDALPVVLTYKKREKDRVGWKTKQNRFSILFFSCCRLFLFTSFFTSFHPFPCLFCFALYFFFWFFSVRAISMQFDDTITFTTSSPVVSFFFFVIITRATYI